MSENKLTELHQYKNKTVLTNFGQLTKINVFFFPPTRFEPTIITLNAAWETGTYGTDILETAHACKFNQLGCHFFLKLLTFNC